MNSTRITSFVVCLSLACLVLAGTALGGTIKATEVTYADEVTAKDVVYTIPAGNKITWKQDVLRVGGATGKFTLKGILSGNAEFSGSGADLPQVGDLTQTDGVPASNISSTPGVVTLLTLASGDTLVEWTITAQFDFTQKPTFTIDTAGWKIKDVDNALGAGDITFTIETRDTNSGTPIAGGSGTDTWLVTKAGVKIEKALVATTATIDVAKARKEFVATTPDAKDQDNGATVGIDGSVATILGAGGTDYTLVSGDKVDLVITGNLTGITTITWDVAGVNIVDPVTAAEVTAKSTTLTITGGDLSSLDGGPKGIRITVDGAGALVERVLNLTINLKLSGGGGGPKENDTELQGATKLTEWELNGTVLLANFQNGNTDVFASRIYIFNSSASAGNVTARVWTLPVAGGTPGVEKLLGTAAIGSIGAGAGRNIKLAEEILVALSITLPYKDDGGNLVVEITIEAPSVTGVAQVFDANTNASFGIFPMVKP